MEIVNMHKAKTHLSALVQRVLSGEKIVIAKNNNPLIELKPFEKKKKRVGRGSWKGKVKILQDWREADKEIEDLMLTSKLFPDEKDTN